MIQEHISPKLKGGVKAIVVICLLVVGGVALGVSSNDVPASQKPVIENCNKCQEDGCQGNLLRACVVDENNCSSWAAGVLVKGSCGVECLGNGDCEGGNTCSSKHVCCQDECEAEKCQGVYYSSCQEGSDGCRDKGVARAVQGKCDVACTNDGQCSLGKKCSNETYQCIFYDFNEKIVSGDFEWVFKKQFTTKSISNGFWSETPDGIFFIIDVEVTNKGKEAEYVSPSLVKLIDDQGREFTSSSYSFTYEGSLEEGLLNPGLTRKGAIIYDVPKDMEVADIRVYSSIYEESFRAIRAFI